MKVITSWILYGMEQVILFGLLCFWLLAGSEGAGAVLQGLLWALSLTGIAVGFMDASGTHWPRDPMRRELDFCLNCILVVALLWHGHVALVIFYGLGAIGASAHRNRYDGQGNPFPAAPKSAQPES